MSRFLITNRNIELLEPYEGKLSRTVLRGGRGSNASDLPDEPVYIMNKIMLGLYGIYVRCGIQEAKPILVNMADWFGTEVLDKLSHEDIQKLLVCEHGSINESYINVYSITGNTKYLGWAKKLNDEDMWVPLSKGKDILNGWHANTQIPKFTGFNAVYRYTGSKEYNAAAVNFWNIVVQKHTWINGGNSTGEHFFEEKQFEEKVPQQGGPESCNSVNMMRLTESLYQTDARSERIDYYERVLYNHILANYDPEQGMCVYYTPMRPGHYKIYGTKYDSFWCCTGTGFEAPAKFSQMIYSHKNDSLYVNLFIPSEVNWKEKNVVMVQSTMFPDENNSIFKLKMSERKNFSLHIRKPYWTEDMDFMIKVNNRGVKAVLHEGYWLITRNWSDGDEIKISFTPKLEVKSLKNSHRYYALTYGPIVLATKVNNTNISKEEFRHGRKTVSDVIIPMSDAPVFLGSIQEIKQKLRRLPSRELAFSYSPEGVASCIFIPYNRIHFSRYAIYLIHVDNMQEYRNTVKDESYYKDISSKLSGVNTDMVFVGDLDSERIHKMEAVNSFIGQYDTVTKWRKAINGGYFMYNLKIQPNKEQLLYIAFRATDQDQFNFDVLVDGCVVKTFSRNKDNKNLATQYYEEYISVPKEISSNKNDITVKFSAKLKQMTPDLLDIRILPKSMFIP